MTRDQILAGCRIAHAEFEKRIRRKLSDRDKMLYQCAFMAGGLFVIDADEDETKAVLRIVGRDTK